MLLRVDRYLTLPFEAVRHLGSGPYELTLRDTQGMVLARGVMESCERGLVRVSVPVLRAGMVASLSLACREVQYAITFCAAVAFDRPPQVTAVDTVEIVLNLVETPEERALRFKLVRAGTELQSRLRDAVGR